ncbi:MAG: hypothetical protein J6V90_00540 [Treponema sp.]|nr:hypothetical protein [Treponema sp.]
MKKVFLALVAVGALIFASACSNSSSGGGGGTTTWTLINQSTHTVDITTQGVSSPTGTFQIAPGASMVVIWYGVYTQYFSYNPVADVESESDFEAKKCIFKDRTTPWP